MNQYTHRKLWPTPVLLGTVDKQLAKDLFNYILSKYHNPDEKTEVFNLFSIGEPLLDNLYKNYIVPATKEYIKNNLFQSNHYEIKSYAWAHVLPQGQNVGIHNHPNNHISGTIWLSDHDSHLLMVDPKGNSNMMDFGYLDLEMLTKKGMTVGNDEIRHNHTSRYNEYGRQMNNSTLDFSGLFGDYVDTFDKPTHSVNPTNITIKPELGKFILFPSWVWHEVEPNQSKLPRISISWDTRITPKIKKEHNIHYEQDIRVLGDVLDVQS